MTAPTTIINTGINTSHRPDDVDVVVADDVVCVLVLPAEVRELEVVTNTVVVWGRKLVVIVAFCVRTGIARVPLI
jgi:hypothetical protein